MCFYWESAQIYNSVCNIHYSMNGMPNESKGSCTRFRLGLSSRFPHLKCIRSSLMYIGHSSLEEALIHVLCTEQIFIHPDLYCTVLQTKKSLSAFVSMTISTVMNFGKSSTQMELLTLEEQNIEFDFIFTIIFIYLFFGIIHSKF